MLFVSKLPIGNRQSIEEFAKDLPYASPFTRDAEFATIWTNPVTDFGNHTIHHRIGMYVQTIKRYLFGSICHDLSGNETFSTVALTIPMTSSAFKVSQILLIAINKISSKSSPTKLNKKAVEVLLLPLFYFSRNLSQR